MTSKSCGVVGSQRHREPGRAGTLYGDRITQLDLRIAKVLALGGTRTTLGVDVNNAMNVNTVLVYNPVVVPGGNWQQPRNVMSARLIRISAEWSV
jgi:hypothetical protein